MKKRLTILGTLLTISFIIIYFINDPKDPIDTFKISGYSATITFTIYIIWNCLLWRIGFFKKLHRTPIIRGVWIAKEKPLNHKDEELFVEMKVKQNFDSIKINIRSQKYTTQSLIANMIQDEKGSYLYVVYITKPRKKYYNIHQIHYGTLILHCQNLVLRGEFFSSELTGCPIEFYPRGFDTNQEVIPTLDELERANAISDNDLSDDV